MTLSHYPLIKRTFLSSFSYSFPEKEKNRETEKLSNLSRVTQAKTWQSSGESLEPVVLECRGGRKMEIADGDPGSPTPG